MLSAQDVKSVDLGVGDAAVVLRTDGTIQLCTNVPEDRAPGEINIWYAICLMYLLKEANQDLVSELQNRVRAKMESEGELHSYN